MKRSTQFEKFLRNPHFYYTVAIQRGVNSNRLPIDRVDIRMCEYTAPNKAGNRRRAEEQSVIMKLLKLRII